MTKQDGMGYLMVWRIRPGRDWRSSQLRRFVYDWRLGLSFTRCQLALSRAMPGDEGIEHLIVKSRRQEAIIIAVGVRNFPEIVSGPQEFIAFGDDDPGAFRVKPKMPLDRQWNLDG